MDFILLKELLNEKKINTLKKELNSMQIADIAEFIDDLEGKDILLVFRLLSKEIAADVFSYLSSDRKVEIAKHFNEKELADIINDLYFDDMIDFLEEMPANLVKRVLMYATEAERKLINQFLNYPEHSAGSLMTIEFVDLKKEMRVKEALGRIKAIGLDKETIYTCYVMDNKRRLEGIISLKDLVLSASDKKVEDLMKTEFVSVDTHDHREDIADLFKKYDLLSVPVVDHEQRLVGIITIDDIVDVIERENTEDFYKMAAIGPHEEDYLDTSVFTLAKKRIPWLLILMISATFTGYIIRYYEVALEAVVALATFIPMIMGTGGNAGSQASTLIIRGIALGNIRFDHLLGVIWKEMRVSFLVGIILSGLNFLRIYYIEGYSFRIALIVACTLVFTVMMAKIIGGILPLIAKQFSIDPAIMAAPLVTTIVDALALLMYFHFAMWFLGLN